MSKPLLEHPTLKTPHIESVWFQNLRDFMSCHSVSITIPSAHTIPLRRQQDSFYMDHIIASGKFRKHELQKINFCRLYLNVVLVSDMSAADGKTLRKDYYDGSFTIYTPTTPQQIHQSKPTCPKFLGVVEESM